MEAFCLFLFTDLFKVNKLPSHNFKKFNLNIFLKLILQWLFLIYVILTIKSKVQIKMDKN